MDLDLLMQTLEGKVLRDDLSGVIKYIYYFYSYIF